MSCSLKEKMSVSLVVKCGLTGIALLASLGSGGRGIAAQESIDVSAQINAVLAQRGQVRKVTQEQYVVRECKRERCGFGKEGAEGR